MSSSRSLLLRTTTVQAFARTMVDESRNETRRDARNDVSGTAAAGRGTDGFPRASMPPPSVAALPSVGDVVGGHYRLVSLLGEGMFGKVYVAQRLDVPEHRVALKLLPRSLYAGRNVERELVMLATVGHPHVVQLKDHGTTPDYVWLTMPVYQGQTLAERLEKGTLGPRQACDIFLPIARGLEALHAAGLRHQDVKPENIFLAEFGGRVHPILLDLGVAAEKDAAFVAGTALYGAPEQVAALAGLPSTSELSEKMDSYGLASTLLYALVGPEHFPGEHATDRSGLAEAQELRTSDPLGRSALPEVTGAAREELAESFKRWLAFEPEARPTMKELCEQLDVLLEPEREAERREARRRARQQGTITRLWVAFGLMLVAGGAFAVVAYQKRETLQVAAALAQARREGAASFDKLDTCIASHQVATKESAACKTALNLERAELKRSLEEVMRSGSTSEAEHAREVQRYNGRIKACEDAALAAKRADEQELTRCVSEATRERAELSAERDAARRIVEQEKAERAAAEGERDACKSERLLCVEERDSCKQSLKAATAVAGSFGGPRGGGTATPVSGGTATPATSAAPSAEPAAPPPEPKPAPAPVPPQPPPQQPAQATPPEPKVAPAPKAGEEPKGT